MRLRFFVSIFGVLLVTVALASVIHFRYFRAERQRLVDQQIQSLASSLISNLSVVEFEDMEDAEDVIAETLGSDRITMLIYIRSPSGDLAYKNRNAQILDYIPPLAPQWQTIKVQDHTIRILNLPLQDQGWTLQVGLLLDQVQVHWRTVSYSVLFYIGLLVVVMLIGAFFLTNVLLQPLRVLSSYLKHVADSEESGAVADLNLNMPVFTKPGARGRLSRSDEFTELVAAVRSLNLKMREQLHATHAWTAQMAHELKTPLTIIRNCVESVQVRSAAPDPELREAQSEIDHLSLVISGFLDWIRLEKSSARTEELHALHLAEVSRQIIARLNKWNEGRIELSARGDVMVFARPELLTQVLTNLFQNALQYSPKASAVTVTIEAPGITVSDRGAGIPAEVLAKVGQPFNWGHEQHTETSGSALSSRGSGLGLAWVKTICEKYGWDLKIESAADGTSITIIFGE